jgi:NAD(P)-dependent dehydrogenase (short-subunit alcohol dehydrogenase family)
MSGKWTLADVPSQVGKRFLITGGNSGVGYYAAVELARRGAVVVLACRDKAKAEAAVSQLKVDAVGTQSAAASAEVVALDLASLASVKQVADDLLARGVAFDGLINNAGVMASSKRLETKDGFELQFGTNVLGHYALTCRLMPLVKARVVTLASIAHKQGRIAFEDLQSEKRYSPMGAYQQSKLGDLMFAFELERKLRAAGSSVISIGVHPGVAKTSLFKIGNSKGLAKVAETVVQTSLGILFESAADGAIPTVFAATAPEAQGGAYYGPQGFQEMRGGDVGPAFVSKAAQDVAAQQRLWQVCAELTGVDLA